MVINAKEEKKKTWKEHRCGDQNGITEKLMSRGHKEMTRVGQGEEHSRQGNSFLKVLRQAHARF